MSVLRPAVVIAFGFDGFISYCRRDAATYAIALHERLEAAGLTVCLDKRDLEPGTPLIPSIERRIRRAPYFILLDTPEAIRSRYVREELAIARATSRQIIRVTFPLVADSPHVCAKLLQPYDALLTQQIWLDEPQVEPIAQVASDGVVDEIVRTHITRRKKRRFLALALSGLTLLLASLVLIAVASIATTEANNAVAKFHDPSVGLDVALNAANRVLGSSLFLLYDLFANDQHWQLRNLQNATYVKARSNLSMTNAPARATLVLDQAGGMLTVRPPGGARPIPVPRSHNRKAAVVTDWLVAVMTDADVSLWRLAPDHSDYALDGVATLSMGNEHYGLAFSHDGRYLFILAQSTSLLRPALTVVDATAGVVLQSAPLSPTPSDGTAALSLAAERQCAAQEHSISVGIGAVLVCSRQEAFGFDVAASAMGRRYQVDAETRGRVVAGATYGPGESIVYWLSTNKIYACSPTCELAKSENDVQQAIGADDIRTVSVAPGRDGALNLSLTGTKAGAGTDARRLRLATAADGVYVERDESGQALVRTADGSTRAPFGEPFLLAGSKATAAALTSSGSVAAIAFDRDRGSILAIGTKSFWGGMTWHAMETVGRVLAVKITANGDAVTTLEDWHAALVTQTYRFSGRPTSADPP